MTDEKLNELKKGEQWYKAAIEAASDDKTKAGLEKLMEYTSDAIDHELFTRAEIAALKKLDDQLAHAHVVEGKSYDGDTALTAFFLVDSRNNEHVHPEPAAFNWLGEIDGPFYGYGVFFNDGNVPFLRCVRIIRAGVGNDDSYSTHIEAVRAVLILRFCIAARLAVIDRTEPKRQKPTHAAQEIAA